MNTNIVNQLEQAQKDFEAKKADLQASYDKKKADLINKVKAELLTRFKEAADILAALPADHREDFFVGDGDFTQPFKTLGLTLRNGKGPRRGIGAGSSRVSDEDILAFISTEKRTKEIKEKFGLSDVTVSKRLNGLLKKKKVMMMQEGTSKSWSKA